MLIYFISFRKLINDFKYYAQIIFLWIVRKTVDAETVMFAVVQLIRGAIIAVNKQYSHFLYYDFQISQSILKDYRKDAHRQMTQIGVIGSSRTLTGSRLATKTILGQLLLKL